MSPAARSVPLGGVSMWPLTAPWRAWIDHDGAKALQPGDLAVYVAADGRLVFHRVRSVDAEVVRFRADTLGHDDPPVPRPAVIGRVNALQLGTLRVPLPRSGRGIDGYRALGIAWSCIAPRLRRSVGPPTRRWRHRVRRALDARTTAAPRRDGLC